MDLVVLAIVFVMFGLTVGLAVVCERLGEKR